MGGQWNLSDLYVGLSRGEPIRRRDCTTPAIATAPRYYGWFCGLSALDRAGVFEREPPDQTGRVSRRKFLSHQAGQTDNYAPQVDAPAEVDQVRLPASRTDLAPVHVARTLGILAALLYAGSVAAVAVAAFAVGRIPIMGLASPFLSAGATQWASFSLLLAWLFIPPSRPDVSVHR
jgi:hypothetical protein